MLQETASSQDVTAMPTFLFFRNKVKIDKQRGADPNMLEEKIKKWYGDGEGGDEDVAVKGHVSAFPKRSRSEFSRAKMGINVASLSVNLILRFIQFYQMVLINVKVSRHHKVSVSNF